MSRRSGTPVAASIMEGIWLLQHVHADTDAVEDELVECLEDDGVTASRGMTDAELAQLLEAVGASDDAWTCREVYLITSGTMQPLPPDGPSG